MNDITLKTAGLARRDIPHTVSPGLWTLAWRRLATDSVAMVSLLIVAAFIVLLVLSALGLVASDWSREVGVNYAPPTFVGADAVVTSPTSENALAEPTAPASPAPAGAVSSSVVDPLADVMAEIRASKAAPVAPPVAVDSTEPRFVDPLADVMKDIDAAKGPAVTITQPVDPLADVMKDIQGKRGAAAAVDDRRMTLPFGADKWGRDVIAKTIKGSETSIFVGLAALLF